ncbi:hypothetical protein HMPREF0591_0310 [Mycobacterium parascrofulaceum ATCC BAA-614]|uniref:Uncharacterized protein n=1 Tax=Mycobacterium parascrofulaceum ATCC BAA-614 TaxID=525368 RepID=D5P2C4_9MYCO|nr:hypothetical protein HMPREF0591_0310 [Mycobacterium parascrofulaceum ATCC BAA-614]
MRWWWIGIRVESTTISERSDQLAAERQGGTAFPKRRNVTSETRRDT